MQGFGVIVAILMPVFAAPDPAIGWVASPSKIEQHGTGNAGTKWGFTPHTITEGKSK